MNIEDKLKATIRKVGTKRLCLYYIYMYDSACLLLMSSCGHLAVVTLVTAVHPWPGWQCQHHGLHGEAYVKPRCQADIQITHSNIMW